MRYQLRYLPEPLELALGRRLAAAGHVAEVEAVDALVVGLGVPGPTEATVLVTQDAWNEAIASIHRAFAAVRDLAAELVGRQAPGRIVVVVDPPAVRVAEGTVVSAVSGAFLTTIAEVAAVDLGPRRIAVNVVVAGWTAPAPSALAAGTPLGRLAQPDEIAAACEFLLGERASFVNGATLVVDGGYRITKASGPNPFTAGAVQEAP
jgi:3-oxoacyl-[acyl-carrier protein] reductase